MDFLKKFADSNEGNKDENKNEGQGDSGNLLGKLNNALGGGASGEKKEDAVDKAVDFFQEHVLKAGPQTNESAIEQAKDEHISDAIRSGFKSMTGKDIPIADK
ncbi:hypothetical protein D9615_009243 [Tricholomella constricta]|uniref:Uncharacterized protein n=1 Tax=Tricholomella constricta TaxID=117010 RepID=A0A8H5GVY2_9AGAR|nr:hypothetical protein D9615_009243 [Tricholomella constricta]